MTEHEMRLETRRKEVEQAAVLGKFESRLFFVFFALVKAISEHRTWLHRGRLELVGGVGVGGNFLLCWRLDSVQR